jgi:hypothetical protein
MGQLYVHVHAYIHYRIIIAIGMDHPQNPPTKSKMPNSCTTTCTCSSRCALDKAFWELEIFLGLLHEIAPYYNDQIVCMEDWLILTSLL